MSQLALRAIIALAGALLLGIQASRAPAGSMRQRAFLAAAGGLTLFGIGNGLVALGFLNLALIQALSVGGMLLFVVAAGLLFMAYTKGEMAGQVEQMRQRIEEERERRNRPR